MNREQKLAGAWQCPWCFGALLVTATVLAYLPAMQGQFVWDDDSWTTKVAGLLRDFSGLWTIWSHPGALQQYYPMTGTTFWLDYQLWGFWTLPYHMENVLLHVLAALLFWRLLCRLQVPGAWLAASIFALHPVMVESAGWITERKNVLSLVLYLGALLAYGRFARFWQPPPLPRPGNPNLNPNLNPNPNLSPNPNLNLNRNRSASSNFDYDYEEDDEEETKWGAYTVALILFLAAMLAKATAFSLPAVLLLLCWWKRGRIGWRKDVVPSLPFFALAISLGLMMSWLERNHVGAQGADWALSWPQRCLIAGRALWFYTGKLLWPASLCFVYPQWHPNAASLWQWLYPLSAVGVFVGLWLARKRIGRGPMTAALFFAGTLFPVLGFMNAYGMRYSFVWDHWVYLSSLGLIALAAALVVRAAERMFVVPALAGPPSAADKANSSLAALAAARSLPAKPGTTGMNDLRSGWFVFGFGALVLPLLAALTWQQSKLYVDMETLWRTTLAKNPNAAMAHTNLGLFVLGKGQIDEAIAHFRTALQIQPAEAESHDNLGTALLQQGKTEEAAAHFRQALEVQPANPAAHNALGSILLQTGQADEAIAHFRKALKIQPRYGPAYINLGNALFQKGLTAEAITQYERALQVSADSADAHSNLGVVLLQQGRVEEAITHLEAALELNPGSAMARFNLGNACLQKGQVTLAIAHYDRSLELNPASAETHYNLGLALLQNGQANETVAHFQKALEIRPDFAEARTNLARLLRGPQN